MEIQEKHRLEILNAKRNYVCAVDVLQKKMSYGEDVSCCINKLYLAQKLIGRLECFCFESPVSAEGVSAEFTFTVANSAYLAETIIQLTVNGVQVGSLLTSAVAKPLAWASLLDEAGISYVLVDNGADSTFTLTMECNITEIIAYVTTGRYPSQVTVSATLTNTVVGVCEVSTPPCYNCIENSDLPKMYEVLHKLLQ